MKRTGAKKVGTKRHEKTPEPKSEGFSPAFALGLGCWSAMAGGGVNGVAVAHRVVRLEGGDGRQAILLLVGDTMTAFESRIIYTP